MLLTVTEQDTINTAVFNVILREREVHGYQINIDNYINILNSLPTEDIPESIASYINVMPDDLPLDMDLETLMLLSKYRQRVEFTKLIRTERLEQAKAKALLEGMKAQIPADQLETLIADALIRINAQTPTI